MTWDQREGGSDFGCYECRGLVLGCWRCGGRAADNRAMPQSSREKQEAFRARQAMLGNTEVRGIYAPPVLHAAIKEFAQKLVAAEAKTRPIGGFPQSSRNDEGS